MSRIVQITAVCVFTLSLLAAYSTVALAGAQQEKMKACNQEAGKNGLRGEERKKFMSSCLSGRATEAKPQRTSQETKMKECDREAKDKDLTGDDHQKFMSECLKG
jgi:hypothetical protein